MKNLFLLYFCSLSWGTFAQNEPTFFTSFDGTNIHYEVKGEGKPVVLIHGFIVNSESWKKATLYNDLLNSGYQVITLDLRGNGLSGKPHTPEAYLNDAEAKDIMGLLKMLKIKHYHVVGYSRGSIIAARLMVLDKRVKSAVLGGMGIDFTNPEWPRRIMFYHALMGEPVKELEGMVKRVKDMGLDQLALAYMQNGQPSTSKEALGKVKKPVLVICGDKDEDNGKAGELAALLPKSVQVTVPGNHGGTMQTPAFAKEVLHFLGKN